VVVFVARKEDGKSVVHVQGMGYKEECGESSVGQQCESIATTTAMGK
jgi:hypothetical protein